MSMPPVDKTFAGTMKDWLTRLTLVERRLAISGGGGGSGITTIQEGDGIDITGAGTGGDPMIISIEDDVLLPPLPDPVRYAPGTTHIPAATAWGTQLPGTAVQSMTVTRPTWVLVTFGAWMQSSAGETRAGIVLGGATVVSPPNSQQTGLVNSGAWGQTLYMGALDLGGGTGSGQRSSQRVYLLNTGTTTFTIEAYIATAGTHGVNYPTLEIAPLYYDDTPVPIRVITAANTKRYVTSSQNFAATDTPVLFDMSVLDSGHFSYNATTGEFTCLVPGQYNVTLGLGGGQVAAQNWIKGTVLLNGVIAAEFIGNRETVGGRAYHANQTLTLALNDKIQATAATNVAGGAITVSGGRSFMDITAVTANDSTSTPFTDTGWVDVSSVITGGFTVGAGRMQARRIGNQVELRGSITAPSVSAGSGSIDFGTAVPAEFRPSTNIAIGTGYTTAAVTAAIIRTDGTLAVGRQIAFSGTFLYTINFMAN